MAIWVAAFLGTGLGSAAQALSWKENHEGWVRTIQYSREDDANLADAQQATLDADDRNNLELQLKLALGFATCVGLAWLYRKKVPPARRGGVRAMLMGVLLAALLALAGVVVIGMAMKGAITG